jgi:hypothetical protein
LIPLLPARLNQQRLPIPRTVLPPLSASSQILSGQDQSAQAFNFQFFIHKPSGCLLLRPEADVGLLEAVRHARHCEPEAHLEEAADLIWQALGSTERHGPSRHFFGLTNKDHTLVQLLNDRAGTSDKPYQILLPERHPLEAQEIVSHCPSKIAYQSGSILIVRHLLEHARNIDSFLAGLWEVIDDNGMCLIEIPDSTSLFIMGDLTQLWEEHTAYFTPQTFHKVIQYHRFEMIAEQSISSDGEQICLALIRRAKPPRKISSGEPEPQEVRHFLSRLPIQLKRIASKLEVVHQEYAIYIFGANHIAGTFLDLLADKASFVESVLDDDCEKTGCRIGLSSTLIILPHDLLSKKPVYVLVAVNEGRAPDLYQRLQLMFPAADGHKVESITQFFVKAWDQIS